MASKKLHLGTVSSGTMIAKDVYDAIVTYLDIFRPQLSERLQMSWFSNNNIEYLTWEIAFDLMNQIAPKGYYFGAHSGDGCNYGFWKSEA